MHNLEMSEIIYFECCFRVYSCHSFYVLLIQFIISVINEQAGFSSLLRDDYE